MIIAVIILSIALSSTAQIMLKLGVGATTWAEGTPVLTNILRLGLNTYVLAGITLHVLALVTWLYVLKHVDVSYAYPFIALGFVFILFMGHFFLNENVNTFRIIGVAFISVGIFFISRS